MRDPVKAKEKAPARVGAQTGAALCDSLGGAINARSQADKGSRGKPSVRHVGRRVVGGRAWA